MADDAPFDEGKAVKDSRIGAEELDAQFATLDWRGLAVRLQESEA